MRLPNRDGLFVINIPSPGDRNIWRIGFVQSGISTPAAEVICVNVVSGDSQERGTKHHRLGIPRMLAPTTLSPSSFPRWSNKVSEREKKT